MLSLYNAKKQNTYDVYFKSIEKLKNNPEYIENEMKIRVIRKVLAEHSDIPSEMIETLIEAVQENVALEYESVNFFKF